LLPNDSSIPPPPSDGEDLRSEPVRPSCCAPRPTLVLVDQGSTRSAQRACRTARRAAARRKAAGAAASIARERRRRSRAGRDRTSGRLETAPRLVAAPGREHSARRARRGVAPSAAADPSSQRVLDAQPAVGAWKVRSQRAAARARREGMAFEHCAASAASEHAKRRHFMPSWTVEAPGEQLWQSSRYSRGTPARSCTQPQRSNGPRRQRECEFHWLPNSAEQSSRVHGPTQAKGSTSQTSARLWVDVRAVALGLLTRPPQLAHHAWRKSPANVRGCPESRRARRRPLA